MPPATRARAADARQKRTEVAASKRRPRKDGLKQRSDGMFKSCSGKMPFRARAPIARVTCRSCTSE